MCCGAQARTLEDELIFAEADLDLTRQGKEKMFNFAAHRRPQWYGSIVDRVGAVEPPVAAE
jgi:N-carbamoyl-D-amino-acid hydrolase